MSEKGKSAKTNTSVKDVIAALGDEQTISDSRTLMEVMHRISGSQPKLWNVGTIGFDEYHFQYEGWRAMATRSVSIRERARSPST